MVGRVFLCMFFFFFFFSVFHGCQNPFLCFDLLVSLCIFFKTCFPWVSKPFSVEGYLMTRYILFLVDMPFVIVCTRPIFFGFCKCVSLHLI